MPLSETCAIYRPAVIAAEAAGYSEEEVALYVDQDAVLTEDVDGLVLMTAPVKVTIDGAKLSTGIAIAPDADGATVTISNEEEEGGGYTALPLTPDNEWEDGDEDYYTYYFNSANAKEGHYTISVVTSEDYEKLTGEGGKLNSIDAENGLALTDEDYAELADELAYILHLKYEEKQGVADVGIPTAEEDDEDPEKLEDGIEVTTYEGDFLVDVELPAEDEESAEEPEVETTEGTEDEAPVEEEVEVPEIAPLLPALDVPVMAVPVVEGA